MRLTNEKAQFLQLVSTKVQALLRDAGLEATSSVLDEIAQILDSEIIVKEKAAEEKAQKRVQVLETQLQQERNQRCNFETSNDNQRKIITDLRKEKDELLESHKKLEEQIKKMASAKGGEL